MRGSAVALFALLSLSAVSWSCGRFATGDAICDKLGIESVADAMGGRGRSRVIVVVEPTGSAKSAESSSGTDLKRVEADAVRYLYGSGPEMITVSQAYNCGSSRDPDYVNLDRGQRYVLFLSEIHPGIYGPYAVPIGFAVDQDGSVRSLKESNSYYDPRKWGVTTIDDMAAKVALYAANTPTPYPTVPMPADILKPGLQLNLAQVLDLDAGFTFKNAERGKGGIVNDPDVLSRLKVALNTTLTFEPTSVPLSFEDLGARPIIIFQLITPVYGVGSIGADYDPQEGLLLNPELAPVQLRLPEEARQIINESLLSN